MATSDNGDKRVLNSAEPKRADLEAGLRFVHQMEVQGRIEQSQLAAETSALVDLLIAKGVISAREFDERMQISREAQLKREEGNAYPMMGEGIDKYEVESPDIPCGELLHLCRAACCNLMFSLSLQDLEEGVVRWNYGAPYQIRQDAVSGKCVHFANGTGCTVYDKRPVACRKYDCRQDTRIWEDFEKRIPAKNLISLAAIPVVGE